MNGVVAETREIVAVREQERSLRKTPTKKPVSGKLVQKTERVREEQF